jgi:hypothetical protein
MHIKDVAPKYFGTSVIQYIQRAQYARFKTNCEL